MRLTFVTGNAGKLAEARALLGPAFDVVGDARGYPEIQADTLDEVCRFGAQWLLSHGLAPPFVLEDSGLFVDALGGFPGVYSRHALDTLGLPGLLRLMADVPEPRRGAHFATTLHWVDVAGAHHQFHGRCDGRIAAQPRGQGGFGFDPVFLPRGAERTFAELGAAEKNAVSHRGQAVRAWAAAVRGH